MSKNVEKLGPVKDEFEDKFKHGSLIELLDHGFETYKIDGKTVIRGKEDEFLDYVLMSDQYFYDNWITQFALGEFGGKNYFDYSTWSELTERYTKGVIVVHEETKQFLFLIPKFIEPQYSENAKDVVSRLCNIAGHAKFQQNEQQAKTLEMLANKLSYIADNDIPNEGLTALIPTVIYEFYDIVPKAMKAAIYIRDHYKTISSDDEEFDKLSNILKNHFRGKLLSDNDKLYLLKLTNNEFNFEDGIEDNNEPKQVINQKPVVEEEYDPMSD